MILLSLYTNFPELFEIYYLSLLDIYMFYLQFQITFVGKDQYTKAQQVNTREYHCFIFLGLPRFTLSPRSRAIVKGDSITLSCAAKAIPSPYIRWKFNGNYLHDSNNFILDGTNLVIKNAENNHLFEGNYMCEASNSVGKINATSQLKVYGKYIERSY